MKNLSLGCLVKMKICKNKILNNEIVIEQV